MSHFHLFLINTYSFQSKAFRLGSWPLLVTMVVGAQLLYATVIVQFVSPSTVTCLVLPCVRELGFAIFYGGIIIKMYKILAEFHSRKAHRVQIKDKGNRVRVCQSTKIYIVRVCQSAKIYMFTLVQGNIKRRTNSFRPN